MIQRFDVDSEGAWTTDSENGWCIGYEVAELEAGLDVVKNERDSFIRTTYMYWQGIWNFGRAKFLCFHLRICIFVILLVFSIYTCILIFQDTLIWQWGWL